MSQGLPESKLYKPSIEHDQRCVILCDGFYEWQKLEKTGGSSKNTGLVMTKCANLISFYRVSKENRSNFLRHRGRVQTTWTNEGVLKWPQHLITAIKWKCLHRGEGVKIAQKSVHVVCTWPHRQFSQIETLH